MQDPAVRDQHYDQIANQNTRTYGTKDESCECCVSLCIVVLVVVVAGCRVLGGIRGGDSWVH